jgi:hypothetical protein
MANTALKTSMKTELIEMINEGLSSSNRYYLFVGRILPYEDDANTVSVEGDTNPPSLGQTARSAYDAARNMLFMKRIQTDNIRIVIDRHDWTSGTAYDQYSESNDMSGKVFYVMTSEYNVYKCISASGKSTIMPTGKSPNPITLLDGYVWKYIYTVPEDYIGFITLEYIPVFIGDEKYQDQRLVESTAKPGSIDSISFNSSYSPEFSKAYKYGRFCTNITSFYSDTGKTSNAAGSSYITFDVVGEASSPGDSYWNDYALHVTDGPGIGQYFRIINFYKGGAGSSYYYANVYPSIERDLTTSSVVKVVPYLVIDGDGSDSLVTPVVSLNKKITGLSIVKSGINYTYAKPRVVTEANSATIGSQITQLNNSMSASLSIPRGHGFNAIRELGGANLMIAVDIANTEGGRISSRNDYRQFGIIKNPMLYGGITLAGDEEVVSLKALIIKEPTKQDIYSISTFAPGNYIFGKETGANARILSSERISGSKYHRLYLTDVSGNFRFTDPNSLASRVYYSSSYSPASPLATGDNAYQYISNGGITLSAQGKVRSLDGSGRTILIDTSYGSFQSGLNISFSSASTLSSANIVNVDQEYGEVLAQMVKGQTSGSRFLTFGGDENFGRLASTSLIPTQVDEVGEYRATTRLAVTSGGAAFNDRILSGVNCLDGQIRQTDSTTLRITTGDIVDFVVSSGVGVTGTLHLCNVTGSFNLNDPLRFVEKGTTAELSQNMTTTSITRPEVDIGSGDLLYIENVRPIERNVEQSEEFKIVIGF